jgi:hypothetical protein
LSSIIEDLAFEPGFETVEDPRDDVRGPGGIIRHRRACRASPGF